MKSGHFLLILLIVCTLLAVYDITNDGLHQIGHMLDRLIVQHINGDVQELDEFWFEEPGWRK